LAPIDTSQFPQKLIYEDKLKLKGLPIQY